MDDWGYPVMTQETTVNGDIVEIEWWFNGEIDGIFHGFFELFDGFSGDLLVIHMVNGDFMRFSGDFTVI